MRDMFDMTSEEIAEEVERNIEARKKDPELRKEDKMFDQMDELQKKNLLPKTKEIPYSDIYKRLLNSKSEKDNKEAMEMADEYWRVASEEGIAIIEDKEGEKGKKDKAA